MHLFHDGGHLGRGAVFLLLLLKYVEWNSLLVFGLKLLILEEVARHNPVDLLKVLQNGQSRLFSFSWHELFQAVV